ncbi:hypothetical protein [Streptomyces sp. NPDC021212]|uniref:hypothetical protein n=1 Tax=Streptomyces sp. NPDC021212 TaxID=3365118 RepID=UPI0037AC4EE5
MEPGLRIARPPRPPLLHRLRTLALPLAFALVVAGTVRLASAGHLFLPFQPVTTLEGRLGSKAVLFEDPEVTRILLRNGIRVHTLSAGSREVAVGSLDGYDFAFPSGPAAGRLITDAREARGQYSDSKWPLETPLVLATYRPYAETLRKAGMATPQSPSGGGKPLYYSLDMDKFLDTTERGETWNDLGIGKQGIRNGNVVLARTSDLCQSNSAGTYLSLVAYTRNGGKVPAGTAEAEKVARRIKPLLTAQGSAGADLFQQYSAHKDPTRDPIVVVYEHQYLAYQARYGAARHRYDSDRVLLYPRVPMMTRPQFIMLSHKADRLAELLVGDPALRSRATALGFRVLGSGSDGGGSLGTEALRTYLRRQGVPPPPAEPAGHDETKAGTPKPTVLERMLRIVDDCPAAPTD